MSERFRSTSRVFSSQWDEDDDETPVEKATSFEDAGVALQESEDKEKMDGMGNYDANPAVSSTPVVFVCETQLLVCLALICKLFFVVSSRRYRAISCSD